MEQIFNPDNFLWRWCGKVADFFLLSCLWLLCCVPIVTIGASSVALYDAVAHCVRGPEGDTYKRFFRTFKAELLRGIGITAVWAVLTIILSTGYNYLCHMAEANQAAAIYAIAFGVSTLIPAGVLCWVLAVESRFAHSFTSLHKTAIYFAIAHLPSTAAITALLVLCGIGITYLPFLAMVLPAAMVYLQSWFIERIFGKYMPQEAEA